MSHYCLIVQRERSEPRTPVRLKPLKLESGRLTCLFYDTMFATLPFRAVQVVFFNCKDLASLSVFIYISGCGCIQITDAADNMHNLHNPHYRQRHISCGGNMSFSEFLETRVCYRSLVQSMPLVGSPYQLKLLRLYEAGKLPFHHPYARQMRKLEFLTRLFRRIYHYQNHAILFCNRSCGLCLENGDF